MGWTFSALTMRPLHVSILVALAAWAPADARADEERSIEEGADATAPESAPAAGEAEEADPGILERETLLGELWGVRTAVANAGLTFAPYMIMDWSVDVDGGLHEGGSAFRHLLSINATLDLATALGWPSGTVFVDFQTQDGEIGSDEVGDYQYVGDWDADGLTQVSELWFEYEFLDGAVRTKIGKVDANWEFEYTELGWEFVHGSAAYPATNLLLPTYPNPATSVNLFVSPTEWVTFAFGVYDGALAEGVNTGSRGPSTFFGAPADLYLIGEVDFHWAIGASGASGRIAVGGWHSTGTFERFDGGEDDGTSGFSLTFDQMLWVTEPSEDGEPSGFEERGIGVFLQYDWADPDVMPTDNHLEAGATWRGPCSARQRDLLGVYASWVHFSDEPGAGFSESGELALELMYKAFVTPAAAVQPYVQYIINPGGVDLPDAVNIGVRLTVTF